MPKKPLTLRETVKVLRKHHGPPTPLPTADPFELVLWENVAYLASPANRRRAFEQLKRTIGTDPEVILTAKQAALERITAQGILKSTTVTKLRECAGIAINELGGDLGAAIQGPLDKAKRALRSFPGIGEPGAEKILLFTGQQALLAPESNGLRVLVRLGLVREGKSYSQTYAASRQVAKELPADPIVMQEAHLLLQHHGQTLCKRAAPHCDACPLMFGCAYASATAGVPITRSQPPKPRPQTLMPGYSGTPLARKLGFKEGGRVFLLGAPVSYEAMVAPLPSGFRFVDRIDPETDIVHVFSTERAQLARALRRSLASLRPDGVIWVSWPKRSSKVPTDITEDTVRSVALPLGLVDIKVCAVDDVWSGLKLVVRLENRARGPGGRSASGGRGRTGTTRR